MGALSISNYRITVPAGGEVPIVSTGSRVRCLSATGPFRLGLESEATFPFEGGMSIALPDGAQFANVRVLNPSGVTITVELVVSFGDFTDDRATFAGTINAAIVSMPAVTIAPGQAVGISGTPSVAIAPGQSVGISGTPPVAIAPGTGFSALDDATVTTGGALLFAANASRRTAIVQNIGTIDVRIGGSYLTASRGLLMRPDGLLTLDTAAEIYAVTASGSAKLALAQIVN